MDVHDRLRSVTPLAVIVMGVSGSGKSTLGAALAGAIRCSFLEGDAFHSPEAIRRMAAGIPLTDEDRWPWLDRLGRAIGAGIESDGVTVASCSALKRIYRDRLRASIAVPVHFVLPNASSEELLRRLTSRPGHFMPPTLLASQLDTLERPQPDELSIALDGSAPVTALCEQVIAWLLSERRFTTHG